MKNDEGNESAAEGARLLNVGTADPSISENISVKHSGHTLPCPPPDASVAAAQPEGEEADETD